MTDKVLRKFSTTWPFPLLIYKTRIVYNEVRKASGIAYILLELIQKSVDKFEPLENVLLGFGIPKDLHYLFGMELANLVTMGIVEADYRPEVFREQRYYSEIKLGDMRLTEKGRKMFIDGAIPTGQEKERAANIFFSPVTRKFDVESKLIYSDFSDSFLGEEFLEKVEIDISGLEDWLRANQTKVGLKAEERIVSYKTDEPQKKQTRIEDSLTVIITDKDMRFEFRTSDEAAFFFRYTTAEDITKGLSLKDKFKFKGNDKAAVPVTDLASLGEISAIYLPEDIQKQFARPCKIVFNRGKFGMSRTDRTTEIGADLSSVLLDGIDETAEFALLDTSGCKYYSPLNVRIPCEKLGGEAELNLLVERVCSAGRLENTLKTLFSGVSARPFDEESGRIVTYCVTMLGDETLYRTYAEEKLKTERSADAKIETLLKMNGVFSAIGAWKQTFYGFASDLFTESAAEIRLDNMIYKNTVLAPLKDSMRMSGAEYAERFSASVAGEPADLICQAMEAAGFGVNDILAVVNVVERYMQSVLQNEQILADTKLAAPYKTLAFNLWKLNDMLGVESTTQYTLKDDYNADEFFDTFTTLDNSAKAVEKYRPYAKSEYEELDGYFSIYKPIHEVLSIEKTAASHPENITKQYIDEHISRGRKNNAVCDLLVKLQFDLRKILQADDTTQANELIDMAKERGIIDRKEADMLHKLRICRNRLQHPDKGEAQFEQADIERWRDIVFSIGGNK